MAHRSTPSSLRQCRQAGMTLIELMVGMAVGLMLVAGLALLFANTSQSSGELDKSVRQIENGRYAIDLLNDDLMMAGYYGEAPVSTTTSSITAYTPCSSSADLEAELTAKKAATPVSLPYGIEGWTGADAAALNGCLPNRVPGLPVLVVRRLDTALVATTATTAGVLYLQTSNNTLDANATFIAARDSASFTYRNLDGSVNNVRRFVARIYYVASCNECGFDTVPTLKRAELSGATMTVAPLAEGIERMDIDYGFDTNADGAPDQWLGLNDTAGVTEANAAAALGWGNVVAAKVSILSRTSEASAGFVDRRTYELGMKGTTTLVVSAANDSFKRRVYATVVRLNSIAGIRE